MTMIPMFKICPKCKKRYSWNPDVGKINCPCCGYLGLGLPGAGNIIENIVYEILKKKGKKK